MTGTPLLPYLIVALLAVIVNNGDPPVPVSETVRVGCSGSLVVVTTRLADLAPATMGWNVTLIEQVEPAATLPRQVLDVEKSPALVPVMEVLNNSAALPVLESVTVCGALVALSARFPNASTVGDIAANGAPVKDAVLDHADVMFAPGVK
jgi:hypothetical protein